MMTTDFLLTVCDKTGDIHYEARYVKYASDLKKPRVCEKLKIEQQYWAERNIICKVVTEHSFNRLKAHNIRNLLGYYSPAVIQEIEVQAEDAASTLLNRMLRQPYLQLCEHTKWMDIHYDFPMGTALKLFFHLAAHKMVPLYLEKRLLPTQPTEQLVNIEQLKVLLAEEVEHDASLA